MFCDAVRWFYSVPSPGGLDDVFSVGGFYGAEFGANLVTMLVFTECALSSLVKGADGFRVGFPFCFGLDDVTV